MIVLIDGIPADTKVLEELYPDAKTIGDQVEAVRLERGTTINDIPMQYRDFNTMQEGVLFPDYS